MMLLEAQQFCRHIAQSIRPYCRQVEIVGEVRREVSAVKALVLVAVPITNDLEKLRALRDLVNSRWGKPVQAFPALKTEIKGEPSIIFHWPTQAMFGWAVFEHTGPLDFVGRARSHWSRISGGGYVQECRLYLPNQEAVETPAEADVFAALKSPFIAPVQRTENPNYAENPTA